jgi:hypothetical protein
LTPAGGDAATNAQRADTGPGIPRRVCCVQWTPEQVDERRKAMSLLTAEETRIEALFVSDLQRSEHASPELIRDAVAASVLRHGPEGCAALVAQEYGEHPETTVGRMQWARSAVRAAFAAQ